jgi:hypothetical protein
MAPTEAVLLGTGRNGLTREIKTGHLSEKPGKMAGLIESINWTDAETTKLNNAQWRWLGPDSAIPRQ